MVDSSCVSSKSACAKACPSYGWLLYILSKIILSICLHVYSGFAVRRARVANSITVLELGTNLSIIV